ncbi:ABC transporter permease [Streptomyces albidoflavus]|nr:ABC transporter permease [Streptomyces albidoflavus]
MVTPMTARTALAAAFHCELRKLARSRLGVLGAAVIAGGILTITAGISGALAGGNPQLAAKLGPTATLDWPGLLTTVAQITGAGGLLGFGTVLAWMFAREFADGTVVGLFALPVSRAQTAAAKLAVYGGWLAALNTLLVAGLLVLGNLLGYGPRTPPPGPGSAASSSSACSPGSSRCPSPGSRLSPARSWAASRRRSASSSSPRSASSPARPVGCPSPRPPSGRWGTPRPTARSHPRRRSSSRSASPSRWPSRR